MNPAYSFMGSLPAESVLERQTKQDTAGVEGDPPALQGAGVLKEESTPVVLVRFPGTLAAGLKHDVFVALSDKRAAQPPALGRTIKRMLALRVSSSARLT
jgi:hypothetical protein